MTAEYDAIVYDLDGTLVRLVVDWNTVAQDVAAVLRQEGVEAANADLWDMLDLADEHGVRDLVEETIGDHERQGAEQSTRLALADELGDHTVPVGVCSLNCEAACRVALDRHGLAGHVGSVVGRDSVPTRKPDPEPLLSTLRDLGAAPERSLFIGDSERDAIAAQRANVAFRYVDE